MNTPSSHCIWHPDGLYKGGKSNPWISKIKYRIVVGHERSPNNPIVRPPSSPDTTKAKRGTIGLYTTVKALYHGEGNATKGEDNIREIGIAREQVVSTRGTSRTRDVLVEFPNNLKITNDKGGSL
jgi:hypothetical protein